MHPLIKEIEQEYIRQDLPKIIPGDTVLVKIKVKEGTRERLQMFQGIVIALKHRGINSACTVRRFAHGSHVERTFQLHSPMIAEWQVLRHGQVRRAKLYYLRKLSGKKERIAEKLSVKSESTAGSSPSEQETP